MIWLINYQPVLARVLSQPQDMASQLLIPDSLAARRLALPLSCFVSGSSRQRVRFALDQPLSPSPSPLHYLASSINVLFGLCLMVSVEPGSVSS